MLRRLVGEEAFWSAVKEYLMTYTKSVVETDDFRKMLEKHSGLNLTKFFDQWFYSRGYPKFKVLITSSHILSIHILDKLTQK
jgi:aminopeptidase N